MKIKYDKEADIKYIALTKTRRKGAVSTTKKIKDWLLADYSRSGDLLGIEILNASVNDGIVVVSNDKISYQGKPNLIPMLGSFAKINLPLNAEVRQEALV